jgi:hypothetical protein
MALYQFVLSLQSRQTLPQTKDMLSYFFYII